MAIMAEMEGNRVLSCNSQARVISRREEAIQYTTHLLDHRLERHIGDRMIM